VVIWYIFPVLVFYTKKNLATLFLVVFPYPCIRNPICRADTHSPELKSLQCK
jgi:hypothetical protein